MKANSSIRTRCFVCDEPIKFEKYPKLGEVFTCQYCGENLEVVQLDPIVVDLSWEREMAFEGYYAEEDHGY